MTTTTLWTANPTAADVGTDWATYTATAFDSVVTDEAGTIANAPDSVPSLRAHFDIGDNYGFNDICEQLVFLGLGSRMEVTLKYDVYLDSGVDYLAVADLNGSSTFGFLTFPGLVGGEIWPGALDHAYPTGGEPQEGGNWSARVRVDGSGRIAPYMYVQNRPGASGWFRISSHPLRINDLRGRVSEWEETCIMNTPGVADGRVILRIDGETIVDVSDIEYRAAQFSSVGVNGIRLQAHVQSNTSPTTGATAAFDYWVRNFSIEAEAVVTKPLRIARENLIDQGAIIASSAVSTLPVSNLQSEDIREVWRATSATAWILVDLLSIQTVGVIALIGSNLGISDTARFRVSTTDTTGVAGDSYDSGDIVANADPAYSMLVHPIEPAPGVLGRYVRIDLSQADTVEAGRLVAGPTFAPTRDRAFGAATVWRDPSRRIESLGQATIIDRKMRQRGLRFTLMGLTVAEADELEAINRENGTSTDILVVTNINSDNLAKASIWGLLETPIDYPQTNKDIIEASFEVWARL